MPQRPSVTAQSMAEMVNHLWEGSGSLGLPDTPGCFPTFRGNWKVFLPSASPRGTSKQRLPAEASHLQDSRSGGPSPWPGAC